MSAPSHDPIRQEWVELKPLPDSGITLLNAHFIEHRFEVHSHETYGVGLTSSGVQTFGCRGSRHASQPGDVMLFNPDEPHDGSAGTEAGFGYSMLYIDAARLSSWLDPAVVTGASRYFRLPLVQDQRGAALLRRAIDAMGERQESLHAEETSCVALLALLGRHGETRAELATGPDTGRIRMNRVKDYLEAHFADDVTVSTLAAHAGLSRVHLTRAFTAAFGIPPHAYLNMTRLRQAKRALAAGAGLAEAALASGFADQSHFNRRFKGSVGLSPGAWLKQIGQSRR